MKRDMELVRKILLAAEANPHGFGADLKFDEYSEEQIGYHIHIMHQAGLVDACDVTTVGDTSPKAALNSLTWQGHEFIDNAKDPSIWEQAEKVIDKLGAASFVVWTNVLTQIVSKNLGV